MLFACALALPAVAQQPDPRISGNVLEIRSDAPDRYTVQKGDTLWGISSKFFREPWRWPEIWRLNKNEIRDPHLIYPGDVVVFDRATGRLSIDRATPRIREERLAGEAVPSIPPRLIEPFLRRPLVIENDGLLRAPEIVATELGRYNVGQGGKVYANGISKSSEELWYVYRQGRPIIDPDSGHTLGFEAVNLGVARVTVRGEPSTLVITSSTREISRGDRLVAVGPTAVFSYIPRKPDREINARVAGISDGEFDTRSEIYGGDLKGENPWAEAVAGKVGTFRREAGPLQIIILNKGAADGLELGNVLALYRSVTIAEDKSVGPYYMGKPREPDVTLPEERYGLVFVFRVFQHVSYALVVNSGEPVTPRDIARTP
ncbi:MAG: LysM peptidoglycan-binding domain-containing protein [Gammaproteobacteria bacterium]|nr:LysM peptidoglycan-binding domain-containing protein [Gammaproteobacteria bacterium]